MPGNHKSGPKPSLTREQAVELRKWRADVLALGTVQDAIKAAMLEWRRKRRALGYLKQKAAQYGVSPNTVHDYAHGIHKIWLGSKGSSEIGSLAPASGIAAAAGTAKPVTGTTAAGKSTNSATSTTARLRLSVQSVEIDYEG